MYKKVLICLVAIAFFVTGCGCEKEKVDSNDDSVSYKPINKEVLKEQEVDVFKITDVSMEATDTYTVFTIFMQNTSDKVVEVKNFNIYFKDASGNSLLDEPIKTPFYDSFEPGEIQSLSVSSPHDLSNAASVEYELAD